MSRFTAHFDLRIPAEGDQDYAQALLDYFAQAELTMGVNTNLILDASVAFGTAEQFTLGQISSDETVVLAAPAAEIWGRVVLQRTMINEQPVLCRLVGVTEIQGLGAEATIGQTVYHHATDPQVTISATAAVRSTGDGRLIFLPLGFAFQGGGQMFFNGLIPLQCCPSLISGRGTSFKDGGSNPAGDWALAWDGTRCAYTVSLTAGGQHIDLVFPFDVPADFDQWVNESDWAFRAVFRTTGGATAQVYAVVGTDGHTVLTAESAGTAPAFAELTASMAALRQLNFEATPGKTFYVIVRASASSAGTVAVESHALARYFPLVTWYL